MGLFEQFPYTNFHEMNLDWILKNEKRLDTDMDALKAYVQDDIDDTIRARVNELVQQVTLPLYPKNILCIGDSYLEGWSPDGTFESWGPKVGRLLGLTNGETYHQRYQGGAGFVATNNDRNFGTMLQEAAQMSEIDPDAIDLIIVGGGFNDGTYAEATIIAAINTFCGSAKSLFPNARIIIADMMWSQRNSSGRGTIYQKLGVRTAYNRGATSNGVFSFPDAWRALAGVAPGGASTMASDGIHPLAAGQTLLAEAVVSFIRTGSYIKAWDFLPLGAGNIYALQDGNMVKFMLEPGGADITALCATSGTLDGTYHIDLPAMTGFQPQTGLAGIGTAAVVVGGANGYASAACRVGFYDGQMRLTPVAVNAAGSNWYSLSSLTYMTLVSLDVAVPAIML